MSAFLLVPYYSVAWKAGILHHTMHANTLFNSINLLKPSGNFTYDQV
jgi:hypothetical protein